MQDRKVLNNGDGYGIFRGKINDNFLEIWNVIIAPEDVLLKSNNTPYTPVNPYNPVTKQYADSLITNWQSVYNPQGISGDVFSRDNHTGNIPATNVTQDANHRFASDVEKTAWNNKEDAIGTKNTAFNKAFGTIAGTVADGAHLHNEYEPKNTNIQSHISTLTGNPHAVTKTEVGLGNVDNTSDGDKPVSTSQQTALDSKVTESDINYLDYIIQTSRPSYLEGRVFYDNETHALSYMTDKNDVVVNLGKEFVRDVYNLTGATIPNGTPVVATGTIHTSNNYIGVEPAKADAFSTSHVIGITTSDMVDDSVGLATVQGAINDMDLSAFSPGDTLYLSSTVAGGFTTTPPPIATSCGIVLDNSATVGALQADIHINIAFPTTYAAMDGIATPPTLTTSYQDLDGYTSSDSVLDSPNLTTGEITPVGTGEYRVTGNVTASFTGSATGTRTISIQVWDNTGSAQKLETTISVPKDAEQGSRSFSKLISVTAGNDYVLRIKADSSFAAFTFDDISFDMVSVNVNV